MVAVRKDLALAQAEFDVFLTADRNLSFQQNTTKFQIAVVLLVAGSTHPPRAGGKGIGLTVGNIIAVCKYYIERKYAQKQQNFSQRTKFGLTSAG